MHFESPMAFLLLLILPVLIYLKFFRTRRGTIKFSSVGNAVRATKSFRQKLIRLPDIIRVIALILLIIALARPQTGREQIREVSKGIAIEMVVDRSSSMGAEQEYKGENLNRLEVVKKVFEEFVMGGKDLDGRPNDLIGMIVFARYPDTICPLTLAHGALPAFLKDVNLVKTREEDGTAIGDALALAAARLKKAEDILKEEKEKAGKYEIKSKAIVLLSDGENNFGKRTPVQAAELAKKWGIKIYAIAIGGGEAVTSVQTPFGTYKVPSRQRVDTTTLRQIADMTGGFFRKAENTEALIDIYKEIDAMEKSEIESIRFVDYRESFLCLAVAGFLLIICEAVLKNTVFRRIP
ncbi:MAG: VWA domain-containing protein [Desulfobacteraceae bacterium]|jgi:Ca-activated chloride channel family protein